MNRPLTLPTLFLSGLLGLTGCGQPSKPEAAPAPPTVRTLYSTPSGFLENLLVRSDGGVVFTSYLDRTLRLVDADGAASVLATLPAHPVGVVAHGDGYVVSAHGASFTDGMAFTETNRILVLDRAGTVLRTVEAPDARFLNGMLALSDDRILIADSIAGTIWSFTPSDGTLTAWLRDDALAPDPAVQPFRPGANGLKMSAGRLYVSNSSRGTIQSVGVSADGSVQGGLTPFASPGPVDDFVFGPGGVLYGATHGQTLLAITPEGTVTQVMTSGCDSCTSVAIRGSGERAELLVLTTGDLVEGGTKPARLLSLPLP